MVIQPTIETNQELAVYILFTVIAVNLTLRFENLRHAGLGIASQILRPISCGVTAVFAHGPGVKTAIPGLFELHFEGVADTTWFFTS